MSTTSTGALAEQLHERAAATTGLDDFGEDDYTDGLHVLLDSYREQAELTERGWAKITDTLEQVLRSRLHAEAGWAAEPTYADVPVRRSIFVTGLPRSGTTALHRLLCADPRHQGLELWLAAAPRPRPPREQWEADPAYREMRDHVDQRIAAVPGMQGMHYLAPDMVEECWWLERQTFRSLAFPSRAHLPAYTRWLADQDHTGAYRRHRRLLQLIGIREPERRWVLKNPGHLFSLAALDAVYPDALIVTTHRDPLRVVPSVSSLTSQTAAGTSTAFTGATVGRDSLDLWATAAERYLADRASLDPARFVDVHYEDFVADPVGTVASVYDAFGLPFDDATRAAVVAADDVSRRGQRKPEHRYALEDFGLTADEVDGRFADYLAAHPPPAR